jgi:hypothetical protein
MCGTSRNRKPESKVTSQDYPFFTRFSDGSPKAKKFLFPGIDFTWRHLSLRLVFVFSVVMRFSNKVLIKPLTR